MKPNVLGRLNVSEGQPTNDLVAPPSIEFENISVQYGRTTVLDQFSLSVKQGEVMALLGPSGSGKTTALRSLAGFVRPVSGKVRLQGRDVTRLAPYQRGIGLVVQQYSLFPHMNVRENVAFGLKAQKFSRSGINGRVDEVLSLVGMGQYCERFPRELSGGQQQRIAIARALAVGPQVLLLDEPLSALDAQLRAGMLSELSRLHREFPNLSILYVTHDQVEALTLADKVAVMRNARLVETGPAQQLYDRPANQFTAAFLGAANLLPVKVINRDRSSGTTELQLGDSHIWVDDASDEAILPAEATLCVRPRQASLAPRAPDDNELPATVSALQWRGEDYRLTLDIDGAQFNIDVRKLPWDVTVGMDTSIYIPQTGPTLVFDRDAT